MLTGLVSPSQFLRRYLEKVYFYENIQVVSCIGWQDSFVSVADVAPLTADCLSNHSGDSASNGQELGNGHLHLGTRDGKEMCCWQDIHCVSLFPLQHLNISVPLN